MNLTQILAETAEDEEAVWHLNDGGQKVPFESGDLYCWLESERFLLEK